MQKKREKMSELCYIRWCAGSGKCWNHYTNSGCCWLWWYYLLIKDRRHIQWKSPARSHGIGISPASAANRRTWGDSAFSKGAGYTYDRNLPSGKNQSVCFSGCTESWGYYSWQWVKGNVKEYGGPVWWLIQAAHVRTCWIFKRFGSCRYFDVWYRTGDARIKKE